MRAPRYGLVAALAAGLVLWGSCSGVGPFDMGREGALPDRISLAPTDFELGAIGGQRHLELTDGEGRPVASGSDLSWRSSNPAVATVDAAGTVTAVGDGTSTITAQLGSMSTTARVTVAATLEFAVQVEGIDQGDPDGSDNRAIATITVQAP